MDLRETANEGMEWIQDRIHVNMLMNLWVPQKQHTNIFCSV